MSPQKKRGGIAKEKANMNYTDKLNQIASDGVHFDASYDELEGKAYEAPIYVEIFDNQLTQSSNLF